MRFKTGLAVSLFALVAAIALEAAWLGSDELRLKVPLADQPDLLGQAAHRINGALLLRPEHVPALANSVMLLEIHGVCPAQDEDLPGIWFQEESLVHVLSAHLPTERILPHRPVGRVGSNVARAADDCCVPSIIHIRKVSMQSQRIHVDAAFRFPALLRLGDRPSCRVRRQEWARDEQDSQAACNATGCDPHLHSRPRF